MTDSFHVLLLDDDTEYHEIFREFLELALGGERFSFRAACNPEDALEILNSQVMDVVFVDYRLGRTTGIEFLRQCALREETSPLILLTSYQSEDIEEQAFASGIADFLPKDDLTPAALSRCIRYARIIQSQRNDLRAAVHQLQNAVMVKSCFLSNMSHELRTPLNGILGFSELLLDGVNRIEDGAHRDYVRAIHESGQRLFVLVDELLALRNVKLEKDAYSEHVDINAEIRKISRRAELIATARGVRFRFGPLAGNPGAELDPELMKFALRPLIENAVKFTEQDGEVEISAEDADGLLLRINDTGIGMDEETLSRAKSSFFQQDNSIHRHYEGVGIGLTVAKNAIEMFGGQMSIRSTPGEGTSIAVMLPVALNYHHSEAAE